MSIPVMLYETYKTIVRYDSSTRLHMMCRCEVFWKCFLKDVHEKFGKRTMSNRIKYNVAFQRSIEYSFRTNHNNMNKLVSPEY